MSGLELVSDNEVAPRMASSALLAKNRFPAPPSVWIAPKAHHLVLLDVKQSFDPGLETEGYSCFCLVRCPFFLGTREVRIGR